MMKSKIIKETKRNLSIYIPLFFIMLFILMPIYWTLTTSLKQEGDVIKKPIKYIPDPLTFRNYAYAWENVGFKVYFKNSIIVALSTTVSVIICASLVGYALARFNFRFKRTFFMLLFSTQFIPGSILIIPLFIIYNNLGLINTLFCLILTYTTFQLPFNSVLMRGFVSRIPVELEEAALIDGCNRIDVIFRIVMPLLVPGIIATGAFSFIGSWNNFLFALMFITQSSKFTIPVGLSYMLGQFDINYGALSAGSIIAVIPALILFGYIQKFLIKGMSSGAVKG